MPWNIGNIKKMTIMTDTEKITSAKEFIDRLAQGISPLTNMPANEVDIINDIRISRCLFYVSSILEKSLIEEERNTAKKERERKRLGKKGLVPFNITNEQLSCYTFSERPLCITDIVGRLNALIDTSTMKPLTYKPIHKWLMDIGALETKEGNTTKTPTEQGLRMGIKTELRHGSYGDYVVILYDTRMQHLIMDNIDAILSFV